MDVTSAVPRADHERLASATNAREKLRILLACASSERVHSDVRVVVALFEGQVIVL